MDCSLRIVCWTGMVLLVMGSSLARGASISLNSLFAGSAKQVRVGTSASDTLQIQRSGAPSGGAVTGFFPAATGPFTPGSTLAYTVASNGAGNARNRVYTFTPTSRGDFTTTYTVTASQGGNKTTTFKGQGVGPVYDTATILNVGSSGLPLLDFGILAKNKGGSYVLNIRNTTTDGVLGQKTTMSLNSISISGIDGAKYSLPLFTPGTTIQAGQSYDLRIDLSPTAAPGFRYASLLVTTDVGVAFGANGGSAFRYDMKSYVLPEPGSVCLFNSGLAGVMVMTSRSRRRAPLAGHGTDKTGAM